MESSGLAVWLQEIFPNHVAVLMKFTTRSMKLCGLFIAISDRVRHYKLSRAALTLANGLRYARKDSVMSMIAVEAEPCRSSPQ